MEVQSVNYLDKKLVILKVSKYMQWLGRKDGQDLVQLMRNPQKI